MLHQPADVKRVQGYEGARLLDELLWVGTNRNLPIAATPKTVPTFQEAEREH